MGVYVTLQIVVFVVSFVIQMAVALFRAVLQIAVFLFELLLKLCIGLATVIYTVAAVVIVWVFRKLGELAEGRRGRRQDALEARLPLTIDANLQGAADTQVHGGMHETKDLM